MTGWIYFGVVVWCVLAGVMTLALINEIEIYTSRRFYERRRSAFYKSRGAKEGLAEVGNEQGSGEDLDESRGQEMVADSGSGGGDDYESFHGGTSLADAAGDGTGRQEEHSSSYGETSNYRPLSAYSPAGETLHDRLQRLRKEMI